VDLDLAEECESCHVLKKRPEDVFVLDRMDIPGPFKRAPQRLAPDVVQRVYDVARRSTTWT